MGPIGVLCVQRTLHKGRLAGMISGLGAAFADTFFAAVAGFGLGFFASFFDKNQFYLMIFGGILLVFLGAKLFLSKTIHQSRTKNSNSTFLGDFISVFFLTLSNPLTIIFFGGVFASSGVVNQGAYNTILVISGVLLGALLWWFILSSLVNFFREKFRLRILFWINKVAGILIVLFGILALINAFFPQF